MNEETFRWVITGGVAIATLCIAILAVVMIMLYRTVSVLQTRVDGVATRVEPLIDSVRRLTDDSAPKILQITGDAVQIVANAKDVSALAKDSAERFADVGRDITDRAKVQIAKVDAVVDQTVNQVQVVSEAVKSSVLKPVKEAGAVLAGVKAAVSSYANNSRRPAVGRIPQDDEMFI